MEKEFVPYELAVKLKELGFNEMCIATFDEDNNFELQDFQQSYDTFPKHIISTPLWQQAFDWFRKEHNLFSSILISGQCDYQIYIHELPKRTKVFFKEYPNNIIDRIIKITYDNKDNIYEEAREACLIKLIELCEKK